MHARHAATPDLDDAGPTWPSTGGQAALPGMTCTYENHT